MEENSQRMKDYHTQRANTILNAAILTVFQIKKQDIITVNTVLEG